MHDTIKMQLLTSKAKKKNIYIYIDICVFQVSALQKLGMVVVGRHNILFCQNIYIDIAFFNTFFLHFSANLTTVCSQFTIKCSGSGQKSR